MSDHANPAADILPRSVWEDAGPAITPLISRAPRITVISTGGGYVRYARGDEPVQIVHHLKFRAWFIPLYDRRAVKSQFSMSLANLPEFRAFWLPDRRKLVARSVCCTRRFALPPEALLIGTYARPFSADAFLEDLDCVLASLGQQEALA